MSGTPGASRVTVHALTHRGRVRPGNEDALAVGDWIAGNDLNRPKRVELSLSRPAVVIVADGMGGHAAGEVASRAAAAFLAARAGTVETPAAAAELLRQANRELHEMMDRGEGAPGMGTTVAGLVLRSDRAIACNVGDSRIYRFDAGTIVQISTDDTPGPKLADGRTAAITTPILTQSLGGDSVYTEIAPHAEQDAWAPGTCYLLCSDGLSDLVGAEEIARHLRAAADDADAVAELFAAAMERGGDDNVTIALVRLEG